MNQGIHGSIGGATIPQKSSDMQQALERLSTAHEALYASIVKLKEKIEPVMYPMGPEKDGSGSSPTEARSSQTVDTIRMAADFALSMNRHVTEMLARITL